jgi:hypothetical protein
MRFNVIEKVWIFLSGPHVTRWIVHGGRRLAMAANTSGAMAAKSDEVARRLWWEKLIGTCSYTGGARWGAHLGGSSMAESSRGWHAMARLEL